jgi:hypothetical protein
LRLREFACRWACRWGHTVSKSQNLHLEGTGLAFKQVPEPGAYLNQVSEVRVSFRPPT